MFGYKKLAYDTLDLQSANFTKMVIVKLCKRRLCNAQQCAFDFWL